MFHDGTMETTSTIDTTDNSTAGNGLLTLAQTKDKVDTYTTEDGYQSMTKPPVLIGQSVARKVNQEKCKYSFYTVVSWHYFTLW